MKLNFNYFFIVYLRYGLRKGYGGGGYEVGEEGLSVEDLCYLKLLGSDF